MIKSKKALTTNFGTPEDDDQNSLAAVVREVVSAAGRILRPIPYL